MVSTAAWPSDCVNVDFCCCCCCCCQAGTVGVPLRPQHTLSLSTHTRTQPPVCLSVPLQLCCPPLLIPPTLKCSPSSVNSSCSIWISSWCKASLCSGVHTTNISTCANTITTVNNEQAAAAAMTAAGPAHHTSHNHLPSSKDQQLSAPQDESIPPLLWTHTRTPEPFKQILPHPRPPKQFKTQQPPTHPPL